MHISDVRIHTKEKFVRVCNIYTKDGPTILSREISAQPLSTCVSFQTVFVLRNVKTEEETVPTEIMAVVHARIHPLPRLG